MKDGGHADDLRDAVREKLGGAHGMEAIHRPHAGSAAAGALPHVTVSANRCENGRSASTSSSAVCATASTVDRALASRLACVSTAPSGTPRMADV